MAVPTGTFVSYAAIGNREDLSDVIKDISPLDTPFISNIDRVKATATTHEWQTDALAAASSTNAALSGDDATTSTATASVRLANYCQILTKTPRVSGTQRAVDSAGRSDEFNYQVAKMGKEIKRDLEASATSNNAAVLGSALTARQMAGVGTWLWDNQVKLGNGETTVTVTSGAPTTAPTAGTGVAVTEGNLKTVLEYIWTDGGDPDLVMVGAFNKKALSSFSGIATLYRDTQGSQPASILGAASAYVSDWGEVQIVADRFQPAANIHAIDLDYWKMAYLRPMQNNPLAKTGDSDRSQLLCEVTLEACNPAASGKVYTTTTS